MSAPFLIGVLYAAMPWAMLFHIPAYVTGEMWIGVCVTVVVDLVPSHLTASAVAIYFFIIQIIGGNMNLLETPIRQVGISFIVDSSNSCLRSVTNALLIHVCNDLQATSMRLALLILWPVMYFLSAALFLLTYLLLKRAGKCNITDEVITGNLNTRLVLQAPENTQVQSDVEVQDIIRL